VGRSGKGELKNTHMSPYGGQRETHSARVSKRCRKLNTSGGESGIVKNQKKGEKISVGNKKIRVKMRSSGIWEINEEFRSGQVRVGKIKKV